MKPLKKTRAIICNALEVECLIRHKAPQLLRPASASGSYSLGVVGDEFWVREAYAFTKFMGGHDLVVYSAGDNRTDYGGPWLSPVRMPRCFSRIKLKVSATRVVQLSNLSEEDAANLGYHKSKDESALQKLLAHWSGRDIPGALHLIDVKVG